MVMPSHILFQILKKMYVVIIVLIIKFQTVLENVHKMELIVITMIIVTNNLDIHLNVSQIVQKQKNNL